MGKKELGVGGDIHKETAKVEAVLELIRKQTPLTVKQEKFCNYACVKRFLKAKGDNVKKAAKQLRACLSWRESIVTDQLIADDFSAELADGLAYVAGHDDESRPILSCTKTVIPLGMRNLSMFSSTPFDFEAFAEWCQNLFGVTPRPH